jgi:hypothetical protein
MVCPKLYVSFLQRFRKVTVFLAGSNNQLKLLNLAGYSSQLNQTTVNECLTYADGATKCQT